MHRSRSTLTRLCRAQRRFQILYTIQLEKSGLPSSLSKRLSSSASHRKRIHRERYRLADDLPQQQDGFDGRRQAAACISSWLSQDSTWYGRTLNELEVPLSTTNDYRQLYHESLESFIENLLKTESAQVALDRLVNVGFSNEGFYWKYFRMHEFQTQQKHRRSALDHKKNELASVTERSRKRREELETLKKEYESLSKQESKSFLPKVVEELAKFVQNPEARQEAERQEKALKGKLTDLEQRIRSCQQSVDALQKVWITIGDSAAREEELLFRSVPPLNEEVHHVAQNEVIKVMEEICKAFAEHIRERHSETLERYKSLDEKTDLTCPQEWFPYARLDRRKIIFHGGPTNSGKTYTALQRLKEASKGLYLGPLRLLAAEIYEKLTCQGVYCNLYTGQERREIPFATHSSATIEMANVTNDYDVVVIDEIQMIGEEDRGYSWTRALLGMRCKEIHVCGGLEAVDIVKKIANTCGDEFELRKYERFNPLTVEKSSLARSSDEEGTYKKVRRGDCVVVFSINDVFAIKREIEATTRHKCCVIYGSLPPQTRSEQARLFNDPDSGYDVLVATDAIGMGLNLNIKRIIFNSIFKQEGSGIVRLSHSAVKQIAGRAGRKNTPFENGTVTCRDPQDLPYIQQCLSSEVAPVERAGLLPTANHIEVFSNTLESYGLSTGPGMLHQVLAQFKEMATTKSEFFLCRQKSMIAVANFLRSTNLSIRDKYVLCMCPVPVTNPSAIQILLRFAQKLATGKIAGLSHRSVPRRASSFEELKQLCDIFTQVDTFLWLQRRFPPGNLMEEQAAIARRELAITYIGKALRQTDKLKLSHSYTAQDDRMRKLWKTANRDKDATNELDSDSSIDS